MGTEKPVKTYFLITVLLFIVLVYSGLMLKNFLSEEFPSRDIGEKEEVVEETLPPEIQQSRAVFSLAAVIFFILIVIFIMFKIALKNK